MHQGEYYQHLVRELGVATGPLEPTLSIGADALDDAKRLLAQHGWEEGSLLIVLAPGAAYGKAKQWIPSHVTWLVTDLVRERGVTCALVGSRADAQTTRAIRDAVPVDCQPKVLDLAGETRLPVLAAVMSVAAACVSNDSGAMHLAAACQCPIVALFGPSVVGEWGPWRTQHRVVTEQAITTTEAMSGLIPPRPENTESVAVAAVINACEELLAQPAARPGTPSVTKRNPRPRPA